MLLASFVSDLVGTPGSQVRYANVQYHSEALRIANSVQEAEKQERFNDSFYTKVDKSVLYCLDRPAEHAQEVGASSTQLTRVGQSHIYSAK